MSRLQDDFLDDLDDLADSDDDVAEEPEALAAITEDAEEEAPTPATTAHSTILTSPLMTTLQEDIAELATTGAACDNATLTSCSTQIPLLTEAISHRHRNLIDEYSVHFPGLEDIITAPELYLATITAIGSTATDLATHVASLKPILTPLLTPATLLSLSVSSSMSPGRPLNPTEQAVVKAHTDVAQNLIETRQSFLKFIQSQMSLTAPNVTRLVGANIAAQLLSLAGGLAELSRIPSCNLLVFGAKKSAGGINQVAAHKDGLVKESGLVMMGNIADRPKIMKLVCNKLTLCARVDASGGKANIGQTGEKFYEEIKAKVVKMEEPDQARTQKALPKPIMESAKKRGGRKVRAAKARFAETEIHKLKNKRSFGAVNGEYGDDAMGMDMGMLGAARQNGALRVDNKGSQKAKLSNSKMAQKKRANLHMGSSGGDGFSTSVVFNSGQGIELANPDAAKQKKVEDANKKWFAQSAGFMSAMPK